MRNFARKRVKYNVKDEIFVSHLINCLEEVPEIDKREFLNDYERNAIRNPKKWATHAPLEEIMVIMTKLQFPSTYEMVDARNPYKVADMVRDIKRTYASKDFSELREKSKKHKYFCFTGREIMKVQSYFALFVNGGIHKPRKDSGRLLRSALKNDIKNQNELDTYTLNVFNTKQFNDLNKTDLHLLLFIRRYDYMPVGIMSIQEGLTDHYTRIVIHKHLTKLFRYGYLGKFGNKQSVMYALAAKAWQLLDALKKEYFRDVRFWEQAEPINLQYATNSIERASEGKSKD